MRDTKTVGGVTTGFVWSGNNMVAETNSSGVIQNQYHYGVDGILSATLGTTSVQYLKDAHGNVVGTVNASGLQDSYYIYDAFGNSLESDPNESNPFGYCGEYLDSESGLVYLRNRYYDTTTGRFTSEDPVKDGLNWYSYCAGNPVMFVDPSGLYSIPLRSTIESAGGSIEWNEETGVATASVNGLTHEFYVGDNYGTYIEDGIMYVEDICVNNMIYAPDGKARDYYNAITDDFGKFVFVAWMEGDGSEQVVVGDSWNGFIKYNPYVKERLSWLIPSAIADDGRIYNRSNTNLSGSYGGYYSGYDLINGANMEEGGFLIDGNCSYIGNGNYSVNISFQFNDIIDPNGEYLMDTILSKGAEFLGYSCEDYVLRINGSFNCIYNEESGLNY